MIHSKSHLTLRNSYFKVCRFKPRSFENMLQSIFSYCKVIFVTFKSCFHWVLHLTRSLFLLIAECAFSPFQHWLSHFLLFEVHNFAAAVQSSGPRWTRLSGIAGHYSIRLYRRPRHLQHGGDALRAAAGHHRADAQRTYAPPGEGRHFPSGTDRASLTFKVWFKGWLRHTHSFMTQSETRVKISFYLNLYTLCISVTLLSTEFGPAGPDGNHQQQHAGCPTGSGWPWICG